MPFSQQRVNVAATATRLDITAGTPCSQWAITVRNRGANPIYLGGADVTTSNGYQLDAGESTALSAERGFPGALYGICASGTVATHVLQGWT